MHDLSYLHDIIILLLTSLAIITIFQKIGLSPVLGYLVAGALIGTNGFNLLENEKTATSIANLGVVFLLFAIGLELTFEKLIAMKKYVLGFGSLQVIITAISIGYFTHKMGVNSELSLIIGSALSLSSTSIVLQVINERGDQASRVGRLAFSVLLLQDLAVIPILVLLPLLSNSDLNIALAFGGAIVNAAIALAIIFVFGRLALRPFFRIVMASKNDALFLSTTLIIILGAAFISSKLGLSFALGAFAAGLMVAETEYKYRIESEILSLKSLLIGLFFMTIGTSFQIDLLIDKLPIIILASIALIICKTTIIIALCRIFGLPIAPAIHAGLLLSQGGEFAFVVFVMAVERQMMSQELSELLMTIITLTMAITPLLANLGRKIKGQLYIRDTLRNNKIQREIGDISKHIIVIGFGKVGRIVGYMLRKRGVNYVILANQHQIVKIEKDNGYNIYYGDALNLNILKYIGIEKAESVIVAMEDEFACIKITRFIHENFPKIPVITKTESLRNAEKFKMVGANLVISKNLETGLQLSKAALNSVGINNGEINDMIDNFREIDSEFMKNIILKSGQNYDIS